MVMECESCHSWVHAACECLTAEQYSVLRHLPAVVRYLCDRCLPQEHGVVASAGIVCCGSRARRSWKRVVRDCVLLGCLSLVRCVWRHVSHESAAVLHRHTQQLQLLNAQLRAAHAAADSADSDGLYSGLCSVADCVTQLSVVLRGLASVTGDCPAIVEFRRVLRQRFPWFNHEGLAGIEPSLTKQGQSTQEEISSSSAHESMLSCGRNSSMRNITGEDSPTDASISRDRVLPVDRESQKRLSDLCARQCRSLRALESTATAMSSALPSRHCVTCGGAGDDELCGRLLWAGGDRWHHAGCVLTCGDAQVDVDGGVTVSSPRPGSVSCDLCRVAGGTAVCSAVDYEDVDDGDSVGRECCRAVHLSCVNAALSAAGGSERMPGWTMSDSCQLFCPLHSAAASSSAVVPIDIRLATAASRRLLVRHADRQRLCATNVPISSICVVFGGCTIHHLGGQVLCDRGVLLPVEMTCSRVFWSTLNPRRRTVYTMRVTTRYDRPSVATPACHVPNITVDHSLPPNKLKQALEGLLKWQHSNQQWQKLDNMDFCHAAVMPAADALSSSPTSVTTQSLATSATACQSSASAAESGTCCSASMSNRLASTNDVRPCGVSIAAAVTDQESSAVTSVTGAACDSVHSAHGAVLVDAGISTAGDGSGGGAVKSANVCESGGGTGSSCHSAVSAAVHDDDDTLMNETDLNDAVLDTIDNDLIMQVLKDMCENDSATATTSVSVVQEEFGAGGSHMTPCSTDNNTASATASAHTAATETSARVPGLPSCSDTMLDEAVTSRASHETAVSSAEMERTGGVVVPGSTLSFDNMAPLLTPRSNQQHHLQAYEQFDEQPPQERHIDRFHQQRSLQYPLCAAPDMSETQGVFHEHYHQNHQPQWQRELSFSRPIDRNYQLADQHYDDHQDHRHQRQVLHMPEPRRRVSSLSDYNYVYGGGDRPLDSSAATPTITMSPLRSAFDAQQSAFRPAVRRAAGCSQKDSGALCFDPPVAAASTLTHSQSVDESIMCGMAVKPVAAVVPEPRDQDLTVGAGECDWWSTHHASPPTTSLASTTLAASTGLTVHPAQTDNFQRLCYPFDRRPAATGVNVRPFYVGECSATHSPVSSTACNESPAWTASVSHWAPPSSGPLLPTDPSQYSTDTGAWRFSGRAHVATTSVARPALDARWWYDGRTTQLMSGWPCVTPAPIPDSDSDSLSCATNQRRGFAKLQSASSKSAGHASRCLWQLDGTGDASATSGDDENNNNNSASGDIVSDSFKSSAGVDDNSPARCPRCRRLYRTRPSMLRHSATCAFEQDDSASSSDTNDVDTGPSSQQRTCPQLAFDKPRTDVMPSPASQQQQQRNTVPESGRVAQLTSSSSARVAPVSAASVGSPRVILPATVCTASQRAMPAVASHVAAAMVVRGRRKSSHRRVAPYVAVPPERRSVGSAQSITAASGIQQITMPTATVLPSTAPASQWLLLPGGRLLSVPVAAPPPAPSQFAVPAGGVVMLPTGAGYALVDTAAAVAPAYTPHVLVNPPSVHAQAPLIYRAPSSAAHPASSSAVLGVPLAQPMAPAASPIALQSLGSFSQPLVYTVPAQMAASLVASPAVDFQSQSQMLAAAVSSAGAMVVNQAVSTTVAPLQSSLVDSSGVCHTPPPLPQPPASAPVFSSTLGPVSGPLLFSSCVAAAPLASRAGLVVNCAAGLNVPPQQLPVASNITSCVSTSSALTLDSHCGINHERVAGAGCSSTLSQLKTAYPPNSVVVSSTRACTVDVAHQPSSSCLSDIDGVQVSSASTTLKTPAPASAVQLDAVVSLPVCRANSAQCDVPVNESASCNSSMCGSLSADIESVSFTGKQAADNCLTEHSSPSKNTFSGTTEDPRDARKVAKVKPQPVYSYLKAMKSRSIVEIRQSVQQQQYRLHQSLMRGQSSAGVAANTTVARPQPLLSTVTTSTAALCHSTTHRTSASFTSAASTGPKSHTQGTVAPNPDGGDSNVCRVSYRFHLKRQPDGKHVYQCGDVVHRDASGTTITTTSASSSTAVCSTVDVLAGSLVPPGARLQSVQIRTRLADNSATCATDDAVHGATATYIPRREADYNSQSTGELVASLTADNAVTKQAGAVTSPHNTVSESDASAMNDHRRQEAGSGPVTVMYEVTSGDGFKHRTSQASDLWQSILGAVQEARAGLKMRPLSSSGSSSTAAGLEFVGVTHPAVQALLQQVAPPDNCQRRHFRFSDISDVCVTPLSREGRQMSGRVSQQQTASTSPVSPVSVSGCARTDGFSGPRRALDQFGWLKSPHRRPPSPCSAAATYNTQYGDDAAPTATATLNGGRRRVKLELPLAMRYRQLCETYKQSVGVYRSQISGRGLFARRDIQHGEMVIEYFGELIRASLADVRDRRYARRSVGCYMFRVDDDWVVDATRCGNAARFINHSCRPNCYSRVVDIVGRKRIVIFARRAIYCGEELTYDYKFSLEADDEKIPCHCGARRCRKYLN